MKNSIEVEAALRLALEALEWFTAAEQGDEPPINKTITAIKEALMSFQDGAQPSEASEQRSVSDVEPVGFTIQAEIDYAKNNPKEYAGFWANKDDDDEDWIALYTAPPKRTWVGLTDEEIIKCTPTWGGTVEEVARTVEAKLKEKNT